MILKRGKEEEIRNHYQGLPTKIHSIICEARIGWRGPGDVGQTLRKGFALVEPLHV